MHPALRSSLSVVAIAAIVSLSACRTHDRRFYTTRQDKNLHAPTPWAPSTTKAADEAASGISTAPANNATLPPGSTAVPPVQQPAPAPAQ